MADRTYAAKTNRRLPYSQIRHLYGLAGLLGAEAIFDTIDDAAHAFAAA